MKLYYVANARLPSKKAYGIQIAKMCEAFIEAGVDLELVIPRTRAARGASMRDFYRLRVDVPIVVLPTLDLYDKGRVGYFLGSTVFAKFLFFFFLYRRLRGERGAYYSIPDTFSLAAALCAGLPRYLEAHEAKLRVGLAALARGARGLIATNALIKKSLQEQLNVPDESIIVEPNGVDMEAHEEMPSKEEARERLGLPPRATIALYVGRFYEWKGLRILTETAGQMHGVQIYAVGGTPEEFRAATGLATIPPALHIAGECESYDVPLWLTAADTLLVLGTKKNETSYKHTAPMKVYEYMAAERPVVASGTPSLKSVIGDGEALFFEPDDAADLARVIRRAVEGDTTGMVARAFHCAEEHSWKKRAERIRAFIGV
ncbi:MAG: glycosyltransferase family 4 protein [Patescibacteria group bacterium]|nr:glycosyltransferase family 4 protein [Patescibacteria group bacterium]